MELKDKLYIRRCFDLAKLGAGTVSPNPLVGAVIVFNDRIIGEGYHMKYGEAHAEVNAVKSVSPEDRPFLCKSTIYINLEPCCIHGNTPPCTDLILKNKIPRVVFSCIDQTSGVRGESIRILEEAGVEVVSGVLAEQGERIILERTVFATKNRPYIILKFAQSSDGYIGRKGESVWLTNAFSKRLVHKWRNEVDTILVGTNTAKIDNPRLTNRLFYGKSPVRVVFDRMLRLNKELYLFDSSYETLVITEEKNVTSTDNIKYLYFDFDQKLLENILAYLHDRKYSSLIIEGGKQILDSFIQQNLWDEARVFTSPTPLSEGIKAPQLNKKPKFEYKIQKDKLQVFYY